MPSPENKLLQNWFAPIFKAAGFKKTGANWRRRRPALIQVFNIQGSQWSKCFYFNLGVYLTDVGRLDRPSEPDCHVRDRLDSFMPGRVRLMELADFEHECDEEERRQGLIASVRDHAIPWLERMNSLDQIRHYLLHEKKHGLPISVVARTYLGLSTA